MKGVAVQLGAVLLLITTIVAAYIFYQSSTEILRSFYTQKDENLSNIYCEDKDRVFIRKVNFEYPSIGSVINDFSSTTITEFAINLTINTTIGKLYLGSNETATYFHEVNITNNNNIEVQNYQIRIYYNTSEQISKGRMLPDCRDLKVVDSKFNMLEFWVHYASCNTENTEIWVKMPSLPPNKNTTIYLAFGDNGDYRINSSYNKVFLNNHTYENTTFHAIDQTSIGGYHSCVILPNGTTYCWGKNTYGELGNGGTSSKAYPVEVISNKKIVSVSLQKYSSCFLLENNTITCYGYNLWGNLGNGDFQDTTNTQPSTVRNFDNTSELTNVVQIASGAYHQCALLSNGSVVCWGHAWYGQIGNGINGTHDCDTLYGGNDCTPIPSLVRDFENKTALGNINHIVLGYYHTCALLDNRSVACWGYNGGGRLGVGNYLEFYNLPQLVKNPTATGILENVSALSAGGSHTCALLTNGTALCWGINYEGQLGINSVGGTYNTPQFVRDPQNVLLSRIKEITTGLDHTCALLSNGSVACWGRNDYGQLGIGYNSTPIGYPILVKDWTNNTILRDITAISSGEFHTCGIMSNGSVVCWGRNNVGQLGNGSSGGFVPFATFVVNPSLTDVFDVNATYMKTSNENITDYLKDKWMYVKKRINSIYENIENLIVNRTVIYNATSLYQSYNLLDYNTSRADILERINIKIDALSSLVDVFISTDNTTYKKITLDSSGSYIFSPTEQTWKEIYIRMVLNSTNSRDQTPIIDAYTIYYTTIPLESISFNIYNPTTKNITIKNITIIDEKTKEYCDKYIADKILEGKSVKTIKILSCNVNCLNNNDVKAIINTDCGMIEQNICDI